jgi:hypothetical protein
VCTPTALAAPPRTLALAGLGRIHVFAGVPRLLHRVHLRGSPRYRQVTQKLLRLYRDLRKTDNEGILEGRCEGRS